MNRDGKSQITENGMRPTVVAACAAWAVAWAATVVWREVIVVFMAVMIDSCGGLHQPNKRRGGMRGQGKSGGCVVCDSGSAGAGEGGGDRAMRFCVV